MEASLSTGTSQRAVTEEHSRSEMMDREEKGVSFSVAEKDSHSTEEEALKLSIMSDPSVLQKTNTDCTTDIQVPSDEMSSRSSSSGGMIAVSGNNQEHSDTPSSSTNACSNKLLSTAGQYATKSIVPPPTTQDPETEENGTSDILSTSIQQRVVSNTSDSKAIEAQKESRNDLQKPTPAAVNNVQGPVGTEATTGISRIDKMNKSAIVRQDAEFRAELKTTNSTEISHKCHFVGASVTLDSKRTSSPPATTEISTIDEAQLKMLKQGAPSSSPRQDNPKSKHNLVSSKGTPSSVHNTNVVLLKQHTLPESSQTPPSASSCLPTRRSSTMGAMPEEGNMDINIQKKSVSASKEADDIIASLTSLSQSLTRSTSEDALAAGADGRPNTFQNHITIASNKSFLGNYPSFPLSSSHNSASTILTGSSTAFVQPGNGVDFGRVSQTAGLGSSAYAALANAVRKNEFSGKNMSSAQMLSGHVLQSEEGYNTYNATTEYSSSFGKKTGIPQERKWAASVNDEYHQTSGGENYGNTHRIHADDQVLMLPLESIKSGGCTAANFMNATDGGGRAINENGAFQTHVGMSGASFQTGSTAAAAAAVLAQQESRPLLLTRFEMLEAYAKGRLCLSCDSKSHRMPSCPFGEFVCPNCHRSSHRGEECPLRCRFCQQLHVGISVTVCIKRFRGPLEALLGISLPLRDLQPATLLSMGTPASPLGQAALTRPNSAFGRSVYVSNLPPNTTQETLAAAVDALLTKGRIMQVDLHEKHAFVQLSTLEAAFELVDKRRQLQIRGVTLKVQFKKTGVFNNAMPHGSATVPCALPGGTNTGTTPIASAFSPNTAYNNGNQSGMSAITPLSAASSPTGAFGAGASPTFSPSINSLLIFLGPPASPSVSEICAQVAAKLKEDLHMGLVTAQQQSPSASGGASRTTPPVRLAQCSNSQKLHELQQLSGIVSVPFDVPSPQSTTVAALFSAAAAAANCQASAEAGGTSAFSSAVLQRLAPAKNALYNPPSSAQNSALVSAAAQYVANSLLGPSSGGSNDVTRAGIQSGHSTSTKTGSCTFESHAQPSSSLQDAHPDGHSSLAGEKALLLQLLQHQQEKSQHRRKSNVEKSQKSLQQPALLTESLMRAAAAAAAANPVSLFNGGADSVEGTGTRGGSYARRQVQLQLQQLEELQKQQVGTASQQRHQTQVSGALDQQLCLQWKKQKQNSGVTQGVCSETRSGQHLVNTQGEEQGQNENMTFSQDGISSPSSGLNLAADNVYNHSTTLSSRAAALKALQGYASIDGSGSAGTVLKNGGGKNGIQMTPFSRSNAESNAMKMLCTNGRKMSNFAAQNVVNTTCATLQHPASWARIPTGIAAASGSAQETVLSMDPEEDDEHFSSASREESSMGKANFLFEVQQQKQQKNGGGCSGFLPSLLSTESTTMCSQEAAMMATKNPSNRMQLQTGTFHHHSLGVQPDYPEDSDASFPYTHAGAHRNVDMLETREETDELYTSHQHDLNAFLSMSSNSKGLLTGTTKAVGSLGVASNTVTPPVTTSRSAQKASQLAVGAEATGTTFAGVPGTQRSPNSAMVASGEATQQLLDVAATLMHKAVEETTDVEEIAQQLYQTTRDLPQEAVHQLLLTLATSGGQSSPPSTSGLVSTPKKPEDISSTPLNPAATPFLVH